MPIVPGHQIVGVADKLGAGDAKGEGGTCNTREDGRELLAEAAAIPIRPYTTVYPLAEANRALQDIKHDRINGTGVLVNDAGAGCIV